MKIFRVRCCTNCLFRPGNYYGEKMFCQETKAFVEFDSYCMNHKFKNEQVNRNEDVIPDFMDETINNLTELNCDEGYYL